MLSLIINGDDFGLSKTVNQTVVNCFNNGILRSASLMVTGEEFDEAVALAKANPKLEVGLHLVFLMGKSALPYSKIPLIVDENGLFPNNPVSAGIKWFFNQEAKKQIRMEIEAQLELYLSTGLKLTHINGHLHFHTHPVIFDILAEMAAKHGNIPIRIPREPLSPNLLCNTNNFSNKLLHFTIFHHLSSRCEKVLKNYNIPHCDGVIGFLETENLTEQYIIDIIQKLPKEVYEFYAHPGSSKNDETKILCSEKIKSALKRFQVKLTSWQELSSNKL